MGQLHLQISSEHTPRQAIGQALRPGDRKGTTSSLMIRQRESQQGVNLITHTIITELQERSKLIESHWPNQWLTSDIQLFSYTSHK